MRTNLNVVNRIEFNSNESEIQVSCVVIVGNLSFENKIILSSKWMNSLLLYFQKKNPEEQIDEKIERIYFPDGTINYTLNTDALAENMIDWNEFLGNEIQLKQIRA
jgi:hypothetical protein